MKNHKNSIGKIQKIERVNGDFSHIFNTYNIGTKAIYHPISI